jgi:hypothetical protein
MTQRVSDLSTDELERLVETTVRRTIEDYLETLEALTSDRYLQSVSEAREDHASGRVVRLSDLQDE